MERIRSVAHTDNLQIHDVTAYRVDDRVSADLDWEMDPSLSLTAAHEQATRFERTIPSDVHEGHDCSVNKP